MVDHGDDEILRDLGERGYHVSRTWDAGKFQERHPEADIRKFVGREGRRRFKYDLFGGRLVCLYDEKRKDELAGFLEGKFLARHPDAAARVRGTFTRLLHSHGMHWTGCTELVGGEKGEFLKCLKLHGGEAARNQLTIHFNHRHLDSKLIDTAFDALREEGLVTMTAERRGGRSGGSTVVYRTGGRAERGLRQPPWAGRKAPRAEVNKAKERLLRLLQRRGGEATRWDVTHILERSKLPIEAEESACEELIREGKIEARVEKRFRTGPFVKVYSLKPAA